MNKLINRLLELYRLPFSLSQTTQIARNTFALSALEKLLRPGIFFPVTSPSLEPHSLLQVVNDIVVNQKKVVVEIGPGLSTIAICRLKRLNNLDFRFYSIESNSDWIDLIKNQLKTEGLEDMVTIIHAPLENCRLGYQPGYQWYAIGELDKYFAEEKQVDLVLVDGPPAYESRIMFSRFPAYPYFKDKLASGYSFYLDDVFRSGESKILQEWSKSAGVNPRYLNPTFAVLAKDLPFFPFMV